MVMGSGQQGHKVNISSSEQRMSQQFSKRQYLVQSIKQTINKPPPPVIKHQSLKAYASKPSYSSYLNTAIDYSKDHSITPYLNNHQVFNVDDVDYSPTSQSSQQQQQQGVIIDQQYDDQIMNEIEMEIYSSQKRKEQGNDVDCSQQQQQDEYEEEQKIVQQDNEEPQIINPPKKKHTKQVSYSIPVKKIHLHSQKPHKYLNFSIGCKLLNANLNIKRVIKCVADGSTKRRQDAKYLVQINNDKKQQKIVSNTQMIYFYKDVLIDYYQALHFS